MKVILLILDGWGYSPKKAGNAILQANLPTLTFLEANYPFALLKASGIAVGLPWGEAGNSEVGHLTLGSGRVMLQAMPRIIKSIQDGSFFTNPALQKAVQNAKAHHSQIHFMGLIGTGSVHSYIDHLYGLLDLAKRYGVSSQVRLHLFTDGKDSPPREGAKIAAHIKMRLEERGEGQIATLVGRDFAMDRDYNWQRTEQAFNLLVKGEGQKTSDEVKAIEAYYEKGLTDSEIPPTLLTREDGIPRGIISPHDSVVFFNYREDSARQLTKAFTLPQRVGFRPEVPAPLLFVTMTEYDKDFPSEVAFKPIPISHSLAQVLFEHEKTQFHAGETQKYAHVTYFFNGMREEKHEGEEWQLIPSFDTQDLVSQTELRTPEITHALVKALEEESYDFLVANFANPDLLAHTGNLAATLKGCEAVDRAVKEIYETMTRLDAGQGKITLLISSDHGHAETMIDPVSGLVLTEHTANDVPFYLIDPRLKKEKSPLEILLSKREPIGMLADIAPTILELFGIPPPIEMTGKSLLNRMR
ncbi:MAG: 2,3-bisphosphoglycerate-independent phosphoglycerate mutase [Candidatus Colwellbacteria bacterium]|nr:2,3-bisphosphoglycerate-independent phosphoglycerate mutase [Candidatus Colwellbacteria bacterium]